MSMPTQRLQLRSTMPAISAPSTTSSPKSAAITSRMSSSTIDQRSVVCAVAVRWPCLTIDRSRSLPITLGITASSSPAKSTVRIDTTAEMSPRLVRNSEITRIGSSSPAAPAASTYLPNRPGSRSLSLSIGSRVPSAVVVSASPIGT